MPDRFESHPPPGLPDWTPDWPLLERYLAGSADARDRDGVDAWASLDPKHAALLEALRADWGTARAPSPRAAADHAATDAAWRHLRPRLAPRHQPPAGGAVTPARPWPRGVGRGAEQWAPVFAIVAAAALAITTVSIWPLGGRKGATQQFRDFVTAAGSRSTITLRDGTRLVLAPATRIRVPSDFGVRARTVDLDGEAYFAVVHDERRPFTVRTSWAVTRDMGTAFGVRAYEEDHRTQVAVEEGSVSLGAKRGAGEATLLTAGALGVVDSAGQVTVHRNTSLLPLLGWTQGALAFNNTPLREVARDLARAFDLEITVADSAVGTMPVTGTYNDEPVDAILEDITAVVGAHYERSGRAVVIRRRGRGAAHTRPSAVHPLSTALLGTARE